MPVQIKLLADKQILMDRDRMPDEILLDQFDPADVIPPGVGEYDALLVRTVSPIDATTIPAAPSSLKFIGSATAGVDHVDQHWLQELGIEFAHSPGCNASAVGEFVGTAILAWSLMTGNELTSSRVGIIGAGHTGTAAGRLLSKLSVPCIYYDPPRAEADPSFRSCPLEEALECDILTFHTPLTHHTKWPTFHWLNREKLASRNFKLILNASRGGVVDEQALLASYREGTVENFILDVWEHEPRFNDLSAKNALIKTPHIAGYSLQSKQRATQIVMHSLCRYFGLSPAGREFTPPLPAAPTFSASETNSGLLELLFELNPIHEYNKRFETLIGLTPEEKHRRFQKARTGFPLRHEHPYCRVDEALLEKYPVLKSLGFTGKQG